MGVELLNNPLWWEGPEFLAGPKEECPASSSGEESAALKLVKTQPQVCHLLLIEDQEITSQLDISKIIDCHAFSDLNRLLPVTAFVLRFIRNIRTKDRGKQLREFLYSELSASEIDESVNERERWRTNWITCMEIEDPCHQCWCCSLDYFLTRRTLSVAREQ